MSDEGGDSIDGDEKFAAPDWRVRAGPRNKPTQKDREEHEATHVPSRGWCTHCMMGRGRTHHHITIQKSVDQSRKPTVAKDYYSMKMKMVVSVQTLSGEAVTCIVVNVDRHQNLVSSVALKTGVEEPWAIERVAKFSHLLGYREMTRKSDTELGIVAFRNRVAEMCKPEVATEDAVKRDRDSETFFNSHSAMI